VRLIAALHRRLGRGEVTPLQDLALYLALVAVLAAALITLLYCLPLGWTAFSGSNCEPQPLPKRTILRSG
jgi:hypothetical protein